MRKKNNLINFRISSPSPLNGAVVKGFCLVCSSCLLNFLPPCICLQINSISSLFAAMEPWSPQPYFVDKSKVVKRFLRSRHKILMVSAPQGFLKSTNMRLMATFVDGISSQAATDRRKALWQELGLRIMKEVDLVDEFFGQWPYVHLTLPVAGSSCFVDSMVIAIRELYRRHQTILRSGRLSPTQKFNFEIYQHFSFGKGEGTGERKLADAVAVLCDALATVYEKPVYVFVDNYDFPLLETLTKGKPMVNVQPFLSTLKDLY